MKTVRLIDFTVTRVLEIVHEMKSRGYVMGVDFDFKYNPPKFDNFSGDAVYNRSVEFIFYKDELATWFNLVYE